MSTTSRIVLDSGGGKLNKTEIFILKDPRSREIRQDCRSVLRCHERSAHQELCEVLWEPRGRNPGNSGTQRWRLTEGQASRASQHWRYFGSSSQQSHGAGVSLVPMLETEKPRPRRAKELSSLGSRSHSEQGWNQKPGGSASTARVPNPWASCFWVLHTEG